MENHDIQPKSLNGQAQDTKKTAKALFIKEVKEAVSFERMIFECTRITGHDEDGKHLQTCEGENYKVYWNNGELSFEKPFKLEPYISPYKNPLDINI
ncbi:hypothetical protein SAMN05428642_101886 [Flaviramulus basaltis]|uniref:Uncharacterized protein n=1 Tax=Flaviramulus basaltis TaxID=369401 RepID=A0A1K2IDH9_9FLAO|nr:hypothetical protein [Flaviramulus basaltis]SFZ90352.1 hypothetical protein SAMN05428642_101886 [Flaviramulus basaltis]